MLKISDLGITSLVIIPIIIIVWFLAGKFLKNYIKSSIIISTFLFLFFSYGRVYNYLQDYLITTNLPEIGHTFPLLTFFAIFIILSILVIKSNRKFDKLTKILNGFIIVIVLISFVNIISFYVTNSNTYNNNLYEVKDIDSKSSFPNIYYIILDEYGNSKYLQKYYNFDNSNFIDSLKNKGFYFPQNTTVNYPTTTFSITSSLNMEYLDDSMISKSDIQNSQEFYRKVDNNNIMKFLKSRGYEIFNFDSGIELTRQIQLADHNLCVSDLPIDSELIVNLLESTMLNPIYVHFLADYDKERILCVFSTLPNIPLNTERPSFIFAHIIAPHPPYIFGSDGESISPETLNLRGGIDAGKNRDGYIGQLQFVNKKTLKIVDEILNDTKRPTIIVLASDHGSRYLLEPINYENYYALEGINVEAYKERMSNFNAIYLPDKKYDLIPEDISSVNTFRRLFNAYLNGNFEILEDKNYFVVERNPIKFIEITNLLK